MKKTLLAITAANQWEYTEACLLSLQTCDLADIDVVVFDDASKDNTPGHCSEMGITCITKPKPLGLTDSWNRAYAHYKAGNYENLIISNNDILVPRGALDALINGLNDYCIVGPLSTEKGVGHQPEQYVGKHHTLATNPAEPDNFQLIQDELNPGTATSQLNYVNGFCFAMNRDIVNYELPDGNLFDPKHINVGNEDELCGRVKPSIGVALGSFIFHFKGVSFPGSINEQDINTNIYRDLTWDKAEALSNSSMKRIVHNLKLRLKN